MTENMKIDIFQLFINLSISGYAIDNDSEDELAEHAVMALATCKDITDLEKAYY